MEFVKKGAVLSKQYWKMEADQKNEESIDFSDSDDEIRDALKKKVLSEEKAKKYFRHLILGLDYSKFTVFLILKSYTIKESIHTLWEGKITYIIHFI